MATKSHYKEMNKIVNQLTQMSQSVRQDGVGALMNMRAQVHHPLLKDGINLILNGFTSEDIRNNLVAKVNTQQFHLQHAAKLFQALGQLCPGMGLVGTVTGLILMLSNLSDPSKIGAGMAVSLLATLYGLIFGTVLYSPIAEKLSLYAEKRLQLDTMIMEGVMLLKEKKSNAHMTDVLKTYAEPHVAKSGNKTSAAAAN
jgi:chemotaxis protein MotA